MSKENYVKNTAPWKSRLKAIFNILTGNFILIYKIKEFTDENGAEGRIVSVIRRTEYNKDSDLLSITAAHVITENQT